MANKKSSGPRLTSDISKLKPTQYFDLPMESKGKVVNPYGTEPVKQKLDGEMADEAFKRLGK